MEATPLRVDTVMEHLLYADAKNCALLKEAVMDFIVEHKVEVLEKVSLKDAPGGLLADVLAAMARWEKTNGNYNASEKDRWCTMRVSDLRRRVHEKGLDVDGSRDTLIAALKEHS